MIVALPAVVLPRPVSCARPSFS